MKVSVFGMGYVGVVSASCLAKEGHDVIGVDVIDTKVGLLNQGLTPIIEKGIATIISDTVKSGKLQATTDTGKAISNSQISFVCVGTPSEHNGSLNLKYIRRVCSEIGNALSKKSERHVVVIRSTILPGTMKNSVIPILEESSGKKAGDDFGVCNNPEFLREGTAVYDFYNPPKTVIGETDLTSGDLLVSLYEKFDAPIIRTNIETAEMVKYVDNVWHALKVGFANEIGNICKAVDVDGHSVMEIFCQDTKLNLSSYYMKPGFAFGGSCLPKDTRALTYKARRLDLDLPILNSILPSNQLQIERGIQMTINQGFKKVGVLGFSFKAGTDDLRESPIVELIERLLGKGYDIRIFDRNVNLAALVGANRDYILNRIPHINKLMVENLTDVFEHAEIIIIGNGDPEFSNIFEMKNDNQVVIDLVRIGDPIDNSKYEGICW